MSSWVVPAIAADLWGMTVDQVLAGVADGSILSRRDGQFLFVSLLRKNPKPSPMTMVPTAPRDPLLTQAVVSPMELAMLMGNQEGSVPEVADSPDPIPDDVPGPDVAQWRTIRAATGHRRRPPSGRMAI